MFKDFNTWLFENLNEISSNSTLYHYSMKKMKVGEVIKPKLDKSGSHWLESLTFEKALEEFRKKHYPEAPTRFSSIYCSVIPRSRFKDKGYLYTVKPIGKMLMTNSRLIDKLSNNFDRDLYEYIERRYPDYTIGLKHVKENAEELLHVLDFMSADSYWSGKNVKFRDKEGIEVICESAIVTEVLGRKEGDLIVGDIVAIKEPGKINISTTIYLENKDVELLNNNDKEILKFIEDFKNLYDNPKYKLTIYDNHNGGNIYITGFLKKGVKLKVVFIETSIRNREVRYNRENSDCKYKQLMFFPYINNKLLKKDDILSYRMCYHNFYNSNIYDIGKYLKINKI